MEHLDRNDYPQKLSISYYWTNGYSNNHICGFDDVDADWIDWEHTYVSSQVRFTERGLDEMKQLFIYYNEVYRQDEGNYYGFSITTPSYSSIQHRAEFLLRQRNFKRDNIIKDFFSENLTDEDRDYIINEIKNKWNI